MKSVLHGNTLIMATLRRRSKPMLSLYAYDPDFSKTRRFSARGTHQKPPVRNIAVLGGGITGLAAAFFAHRKFPQAQVTLFETSNRLGGVIESLKVDAGGGRKIICETGPRTLRANTARSIVTVDLISSLEKYLPLSRILFTPRSFAAACSRYIFHPPSPVPLPPADMFYSVSERPILHPQSITTALKSAHSVLTHPFFDSAVSGIVRDTFLAQRPKHVIEAADESIRSFAARRFGQRITDHVIAPLIAHGLYAGDADRLSARTLLPDMWDAETRTEEKGGRYGGVITETLLHHLFPSLLRTNHKSGNGIGQRPQETKQGALVGHARKRENDLLEELRRGPAGDLEKLLFRDVTWFSFKGGVADLTTALEAALDENAHISIERNSRVESISKSPDDTISVTARSSSTTQTQHFTHVIATTPLNSLLSMAAAKTQPTTPPPPNLTQETTSVMMVTLFYTSPAANHPYRGFGYLIPACLPHCWNPERALAVVFDSDAIIDGQDAGPRGTKISVVLGGHYWSAASRGASAGMGRVADAEGQGELPGRDEAVAMARQLLARHIGLVEEPTAAVATLQRDALPQYTVGHHARVARVREWLLARFAGGVRVAGKSYGGIGVHDCVFSARSVVEGLEEEGETGLE
ncbi:uncharacterized protein IWZ02DRAFT_493906 [Phyllosticta citriasiana]|uniref:uncharacterized protein n=1 Tax=Phyllosticta citriasiana TaxID=595635 RepID=UPI0030FDB3E0